MVACYGAKFLSYRVRFHAHPKAKGRMVHKEDGGVLNLQNFTDGL